MYFSSITRTNMFFIKIRILSNQYSLLSELLPVNIRTYRTGNLDTILLNFLKS